MYQNSVKIQGDLVEPVVEKDFGGKKLVSAVIVIKSTYQGKTKDNFATVDAWGDTGAKLVGLAVGSNVTIDGTISGRLWEKDGAKKYFTSVTAKTIELSVVDETPF